MKKNFFKKLSFVLALAMVISSLAPAAGIFAATSLKLNRSSVTLYVGEKDNYDFNVSGTNKDQTVKFSSSNTNVATIDVKTGVVKAIEKGSSTVSAVVSNAKGVVKKLTATVKVRSNMKSISIDSPANVDTAKLMVATDYAFNTKYTTVSGATTGTSNITKWSVNRTNATISSTGVFNAVKAGKYTITVMAFTSESQYSEWVDAGSDKTDESYIKAQTSIDVTVVPTMTVAQKDLDTVVLTFDSAITEVAKNLSVYSVLGNTEILVTGIKAPVVSNEGKSVTLDFYVPFTEGATYTVKCTGIDSKQFKAVSSAVDKVAKVVVTTTEAVVNEATKIEVQFLDANGVDITKPDLTNRVSLESSSNKVILDTTNKTLTFFTKGDTTTVKATCRTYKYENGQEVGNVIGTGTVIGVDKPATTGKVKAWTIVSSAPDFSDAKHTLAVGDSRKLYLQLSTVTGKTTSIVDNVSSPSKFTYLSSDSSVLFMDANANLYPIKAGKVNIIVHYEGVAVDAISIDVGAARVPSMIYMNMTSTALTLSNTTAFEDSARVVTLVFDQYSELVTLTDNDISLTKLPGSASSNVAKMVSFFGFNAISISGQEAGQPAVPGTYYYQFTAKGLSSVITINVVQPTSATPSVYNLELSTTDADSASSASNARPAVTVNLYGYTGGVRTAKPAVSGGGFIVEVIDPDNNVTTMSDNTFQLTSVSGSALAPVKNGTYTVRVKNVSGVAIDVKTFAVKNTQVIANYDVKTMVYTASDLNSIANECFAVSYKGAVQTANITMGDVVGELGGDIFVKNIKWLQPIVVTMKIGGMDVPIATYNLVHTIEVNTYIIKK